MDELIINGEDLTFEQVLAVAYGTPGEPLVVLSGAAKSKVGRCAEAVQKLLDRGEIAYGITTGFGAFKDKIISVDEAATLQRNIVLSHAVGVGDAFDIPTVRAIMLIRANTLARGFSGITVDTLELILELLNRGIHPVIPEKGSLGASGDLAPLAHFACVLIGEGKAEYEGRTGRSRTYARAAQSERGSRVDERNDSDDRRRDSRNGEGDPSRGGSRHRRVPLA